MVTGNKAVAVSHGFKERVTEFFDKLPVKLTKEEETLCRQEIVRLILQIQDGMGSTKLRRITFRLNFLDDFTFFKNQYLDMSHYLNRVLWVAVFKKIKNRITPKKRQILEDVKFCISNLTKEDLAKIKKKTINKHLNVDKIDLANMKTGQTTKRQLIPYIKSKSYTLNFLAEYDRGLDIEDLEQDLACEMVRVFNTYPRSRCKNMDNENPTPVENRVQMYLERAVNNKVNNLKEYYTCESRRRVATTDAHLYKEKNKIKKLLAKDPTNKDLLAEMEASKQRLRLSSADFYSTTTPLTRRDHDGEEERPIDLPDTPEKRTGEEDPFLTHSLESSDTKMWLANICSRVDPRIANFVTIVVGGHHPEFEQWAKDNNVNTEHFDTLVRSAKKFCNVKQEELHDNDVILEEIGEL